MKTTKITFSDWVTLIGGLAVYFVVGALIVLVILATIVKMAHWILLM